jgi:hypothetical protein
MKTTLGGLGKRPSENIRGLNSHPSRSSVVMNKPSQVSQFGSDSFAERNPRNKISVKGK